MRLALVRAFVDSDGRHGNPALVVLEPDDRVLTDDQRQRFAVESGIPATVFVRRGGTGTQLRIFGSYGLPIAFGGHPILATVEALWLWGLPIDVLKPVAGPVRCRRDQDGVVHVSAPVAWSKPWRHLQMESPAAIERLTQLPTGEDFTQVWAWIDESAGKVRARLWAPRINKGEDEACGSASMILANTLDRELEVIHGRFGAIIHVRPVGNGLVELGGRCQQDPVPAPLRQRVHELFADAHQVLTTVEANGQTIAICRAQRSDVADLVGLLSDDPLGSARESADLWPYLAAFDRIDADPHQTLVAALDEAGNVVATCQLTLIPGLSRGGMTRMQIEAVRVKDTLRGVGLGSRLFKWIAEYAQDRGAGMLQLTTDKSRAAAHSFYERLGFTASHEGMKRILGSRLEGRSRRRDPPASDLLIR